MQRRRRTPVGAVAAALVSVLLMLAVAGPAVATEPVLVVPGGERDGQVALDPPVQVADDGIITWLLRNGGDDELTFALAIHDVEVRGDGVDLGAERDDVAPPADEVVLGPGEVARLRLHVSGASLLALVARTVDATPDTEVSALALAGEPVIVTPSVVDASGSGDAVTVRLDADRAAIVDVAVRVSSWPGIGSSTEQLRDVVVPAGGRDLAVGLGGPSLGRLTVEVAVSSPGSPVASAAIWWWPRNLLAVIAAALIAIAAVGTWAWRRRAGHEPAPPTPDDTPLSGN
jgi:hypothetical protein